MKGEEDTIRRGYILIDELESIAKKYCSTEHRSLYNSMMFNLCSFKLIILNAVLIIKINRL